MDILVSAYEGYRSLEFIRTSRDKFTLLFLGSKSLRTTKKIQVTEEERMAYNKKALDAQWTNRWLEKKGEF